MKGENKSNFYFYCDISVLNFQDIIRNHQSEIDVQKILTQLSGSKERKRLLDLLRKKETF